ncbi:MAG TPA: cytochrome c [Candidatus Binataceae bacterium]
MAITALNSFADVQSFITQVLVQSSQQGGLGFAPHKAFWNTLTFDQFVNGNVPNVPDTDTGNPIPILVKGNSAQSNLILALKGDGPLFADTGFGRMPANGPPFFSDDDIASIAAWIDNGCPQ